MSGHFCTIIAKNYVAQARVLAESFLRHNPDGKFSVLFVDDPEPHVDPGGEPYEVITPDALDFANYERMAAIYDVVELSTAVKPWFLKHLIARGEASTITYLDPDIEVFDDLGEIVRLAEQHGLVLIPHLTAPLPRDGRKPGESEILTAGTYNLGFISVAADDRVGPLLDWWAERLENDCLNDPARGLFVDQRWIDLVPGWVPGMHVLRDPGYNVAYWNLPTRTVDKDGDRYLVDGRPLRFFHYSGFDPAHPDALSRHQNRIDLQAEPALAELCANYARSALDHGYEEARHWRYDWAYLPDGSKLDRSARRVYREGVMSGRLTESPFSRQGAKELIKYLTEPTDAAGGAAGITRYMRAVYDSRADLRSAFPSLTSENAVAFVQWITAAPDMSIPQAFLGKVRKAGGDGVARPGTGEPKPVSAPASHRSLPWGVNVAGYLTAELGVGEAARQMITALDAKGIPVAPLGLPVKGSRMGHEFGHMPAQEGPFAVNVICVNADMLPHFADEMGPGFFAGRHSAGLWFWEVTPFPERWVSSFEHLDEVWTASEHVADAVRAVSPIPVHTIRLPVVPASPAGKGRAELGLPDGFCFLFVFDHNSVFDRKNPLGLIDAFRRAFAPGSGPHLVLKTINGERHPEDVERMRAAIAGQPDVHLIEGYLPAAEKSAMIAACDCYVSLHRSEGFGLTMAEAMCFGKPVIATGYSGNLDFMTPDNSFLVDYEVRPIGDGADPYPADGEWADPDLDHAAALMRLAYDDRGAAQERGRRAAQELRRTHSPEKAGQIIARRLEAIRTERERAARAAGPAAEVTGSRTALDAPSGEPQALGFARARYLVNRPAASGAGGRNPLRRLARRLALLATRPTRAQQHAVNRNLVAAIGQLQEQVGQLHARDTGAQYAAAMAAIRKVERSLGSVGSELGGLRSELAARDQEMAELQREAMRLVAESRAIPFMEDPPFEDFEHPRAGTVTGFRRPMDGGETDGYLGFENVFRGSEDMIRDRQSKYLELVAEHAPVLDAGCGRGEFLDLLRDRGVEYSGVDLEAEMVEHCREKGHTNVERGDINEYLESLEDDSLGTIFSAQVIEHLGFEEMRRFIELGLSKLRPGGLFIAETVNPHSAPALKTFWVDPTHKAPVYPEVALVLCRLAGFSSGFVFHPNGKGEVETDRFTTGEYAVVATAPERTEPELAEGSRATAGAGQRDV